MKILLFGKNGQVGWELQRALSPLGELIALDRHSSEFCGDLTNLEGLRETIRSIAPQVIVNAAAYTAVDRAESETSLAQLVNAEAPAVMAQEAGALGSWLVHYSTDYVFSGEGNQPWNESSPVAPVNFYGQSKLAGEHSITQSGCRHLIFRTSWVYGAKGSNFAKTMLRLAGERDTLNIIDDQLGAPTGAELLADVTAQALMKALSDDQVVGIYHLAAAGEVSWYGYANHVFEFARGAGESLKVSSVSPIPTSAYPTPAARPLNSRMATTKIEQTFALKMPHWTSGVNRMLLEVLERQ